MSPASLPGRGMPSIFLSFVLVVRPSLFYSRRMLALHMFAAVVVQLLFFPGLGPSPYCSSTTSGLGSQSYGSSTTAGVGPPSHSSTIISAFVLSSCSSSTSLAVRPSSAVPRLFWDLDHRRTAPHLPRALGRRPQLLDHHGFWFVAVQVLDYPGIWTVVVQLLDYRGIWAVDVPCYLGMWTAVVQFLGVLCCTRPSRTLTARPLTV